MGLSGSGGNIVTLRRSSDDAELSFTATTLSDGTAETWAGAGDAFVKTWFDQSGNGRDLTQATTTLQPQAISSGSLVTSGSHAAFDFDGTDDGLATAAFAFSTTNIALFVVMTPDTTAAGTKCFVRQRPNGAVGALPGWVWSGNGSALFSATLSEDGSGNAVGSQVGGEGVILLLRHVHSILIEPSQWLCYRNGALYQTLDDTKGGTPPLGTIAATQALWVGENFDSNNRPYGGKMQEVLGYYEDKSAQRSDIVDDINAYYSVY